VLVPWLTAELPGSGGLLSSEPADFLVDEVLAYPLSGRGEHGFIRFEKVGLTTPEAVRRLSAVLGVPNRAAGVAGMKDKHARTRQWMSFPLPIKSAFPRLDAGLGDDLRVLETTRHDNKLRRGHQRTNRFQITLRGAPPGGADRARAVLARLAALGVPNAFGPQRFGREQDNVEQALAMIRGQSRGPRDRRIRDLLVSALQSEVYNRVLAARMKAGLFATALIGDVMQKHDTGGMFDVTDAAAEQPRVTALEISPTAALPGRRARRSSGQPAAMEEAALTELGLLPADVEKLDEGTRRVLRYPLDPEARIVEEPDGFRLEVSLPSGAYATVLLGEIMKPDSGVVLRDGGG
jgi:tRNA pseudouridine13 synthase